MYFKRWKQFLTQRRSKLHRAGEESNRYEELSSKIIDLEKEISLLKEHKTRIADAPIIIENIHIENFKVDKIDYENNFGALGIKELTGQLNIGANYQTGSLNHDRANTKKEKQPEPSLPNKNEGPRCTIRGKNS